jgi:hypothetical protein
VIHTHDRPLAINADAASEVWRVHVYGWETCFVRQGHPCVPHNR